MGECLACSAQGLAHSKAVCARRTPDCPARHGWLLFAPAAPGCPAVLPHLAQRLRLLLVAKDNIHQPLLRGGRGDRRLNPFAGWG